MARAQETVYPGQESTVTIKILIPRRRPQSRRSIRSTTASSITRRATQQNYKKAAEHFEKALAADPTYSQAAYYLGLTYNALFDEEKAQEYYKKAIEIDPDYLEAHANYAGMLLDIGDVDEAIRQINTVLTRQPNHALALTMLAQAYRLKGLYPQSIEAAHKAMQLAPKNAEPHLWLADSLRLSGKFAEREGRIQPVPEAQRFRQQPGRPVELLRAGLAVRHGEKEARRNARHLERPAQPGLFRACATASARCRTSTWPSGYCQRSLSYDPQDPYAHFALGVSYMRKANETNSVAELAPALKHLQAVVAINPDLDEAQFAKKNIAAIEQALQGK